MNGVAKLPKRIVGHQRKTGRRDRDSIEVNARMGVVRKYDSHCISVNQDQSEPTREGPERKFPSI